MLKSRRGLFVCVVATAGIAACIAMSLSGVPVRAQTVADNVPEWQRAAGGKLSFDAASIKPADPAKFTPPNFALDFLDSFAGENPHGRLVAQFPLQVYIEFAYKLYYSPGQRDEMLARAPKWVSSDPYTINAEAQGNPTKDQMRLMMQSLLVDRFKLAVHYERHETAVIALVLDKPGKTGPKLYPHSSGPPCNVPAEFPLTVCNAVLAISKPNNSIFFGARDVTMAQIAAALSGTSDAGGLMVDQTGLEGRFDFSLEWTREPKDGATPPDPTGATYRQAMQDQLGLKLKSTKASLDTLIVDHIERPTEN